MSRKGRRAPRGGELSSTQPLQYPRGGRSPGPRARLIPTHRQYSQPLGASLSPSRSPSCGGVAVGYSSWHQLAITLETKMPPIPCSCPVLTAVLSVLREVHIRAPSQPCSALSTPSWHVASRNACGRGLIPHEVNLPCRERAMRMHPMLIRRTSGGSISATSRGCRPWPHLSSGDT